VQVKQKRLPYFKVGKELRERISDRLHTTAELPAMPADETSAAVATKKG
jgi:hypothetical protein